MVDVGYIGWSGGLRCLGSQVIATDEPVVFYNAPEGTRVILISVKTGAVTIRFDGGSPTAGHQITSADGLVWLPLAEPLKARASYTLDTEGWITYFG